MGDNTNNGFNIKQLIKDLCNYIKNILQSQNTNINPKELSINDNINNPVLNKNNSKENLEVKPDPNKKQEINLNTKLNLTKEKKLEPNIKNKRY